MVDTFYLNAQLITTSTENNIYCITIKITDRCICCNTGSNSFHLCSIQPHNLCKLSSYHHSTDACHSEQPFFTQPVKQTKQQIQNHVDIIKQKENWLQQYINCDMQANITMDFFLIRKGICFLCS